MEKNIDNAEPLGELAVAELHRELAAAELQLSNAREKLQKILNETKTPEETVTDLKGRKSSTERVLAGILAN
jgi:predicted  nucleic acid-binding Zn-ribbon protein